MALKTEYLITAIDGITEMAHSRKADGWRFVQLMAVNTEEGIDLIYSFMKDGVLQNNKIEHVTKNDAVPSISDDFFAAFVFENEVHDLFGVDIRDIAIDFGGNFYALAQSEPMTIISPAQKAAREKARAAAIAKAERAATCFICTTPPTPPMSWTIPAPSRSPRATASSSSPPPRGSRRSSRAWIPRRSRV